MFEPGKEYRRSELHALYGGQGQGGISTPKGKPYIFLFTGPQGEEHGYHDHWEDSDTFIYTGEGQHGRMEFVRGNAAVRDHDANDKDLHLFQYVSKGHVRYIGRMECVSHRIEQDQDTEGKRRQTIQFVLRLT